MPTIQKHHIYKTYRAGRYLGDLPNVTSDFGFRQPINTAAVPLEIEIGLSADVSDQAPEAIETEDGEDIEAENGSIITMEAPTEVVGNSNEDILIRNGNAIKVWEYSDYYPNGRLAFSGKQERYTAKFGGTDTGVIKILAISDGQDLNNYLVNGSPYTPDQSQTSQDSSVGLFLPDKGAGFQVAGQTFTTGAGIENVAAFDFYLEGGHDYTITLWPSVAAADNNAGSPSGSEALGSISISPDTTGVHKAAFSVPIPVSENTLYFVAVYSSGGEIFFDSTGALAGGSFWLASYGGAGGTDDFQIQASQDLYFVSYQGGGATTAVFDGDPTDDMLIPSIDNYVARGGSVNYGAGTIDTSGLDIPYTWVTATMQELVEKVYEFVGYGWYWTVDPGDQELTFKEVPATPDYTLVRGVHISELELTAGIEAVKNILYFMGGKVAGVNLLSVYQNTISMAEWGQRLDRRSDNRITDQSTLDAIGTASIARQKDEAYSTSVIIPDTTMDIALLKPGKTVGFDGFGGSVDSLVLNIVDRDFRKHDVTLTLGTLPAKLTLTLREALKQIQELQSVDNPDGPS